MRLTVHTDYSLRLLMGLALEPERQQTIAELAQRYRISRNHLMKVAMNLAAAGFVESIRGRSGGLRLARPANAISLGEVVRAIEDNSAFVECFDRASNTCVVAPVCRLKGLLHEALAAFLGTLDRYTLADLVEPRDTGARMRQLLGGIAVVAAPPHARVKQRRRSAASARTA
ncbi:MAG: Rrf2 family transcriptional regulator [Sinimarinibacterium sp.]|jgi:Rrf2 family nitric oxide-sensitive transcriptional repressor